MRYLLILLALCSCCCGATVSVNPRGNDQGTVGLPGRRWSQIWGSLIGLSNTNVWADEISTNVTASSTHTQLVTAAAVWAMANSFTGTVSEADITNWNKAWVWVDAYSNTFGSIYTYDLGNSSDPQIPNWGMVTTYVDDNTGTNVVSASDRANWDWAWASLTNFWRGDTNNQYGAAEYDVADLYNAKRWAWAIYSNTGTVYTFDQGTNLATEIPTWGDVTNFFYQTVSTGNVSSADRDRWDAADLWTINIGPRYVEWDEAYDWVHSTSGSVATIFAWSAGWNSNYTWYVNDRGDAADRTVGNTNNSYLPTWGQVVAEIQLNSGTNIVSESDRQNWNNTYNEMFLSATNYTHWGSAYAWQLPRRSGLDYVLSRTSAWDSASTPTLEQVMAAGSSTTNSSLTYSNDFTISNYLGTNGGSKDLTFKAGSAVGKTGPSLKLTGADHTGAESATVSNGWVEVHLNSTGSLDPKLAIYDDADSDRVIYIDFSGDTAIITAKGNIALTSQNDSGTYVSVNDGLTGFGARITTYSEGHALHAAATNVTIDAGGDITLTADGEIIFDIPGANDPVMDASGHFDLKEVELRDGLIDCVTSEKQMYFALPTNNPSVSGSLWSSNGVVRYNP